MRIWFVSEVFDPAGVTTGYYLANIAASLERFYDVRVISDRRRGAPATPRVEHLASTVKQRGLRALLSACSLAARALLRMRRGDLAMVATNPPVLPIFMALVTRLRGARFIVIVHDLYPDVLVAARIWRADGPAARLFNLLNSRALAKADRVIVIGRDMQRRIASRINGSAPRIEYIPNWPDEGVGPAPAARGTDAAPFVVQYSGNMGVTQGVETLIDAAALLAEEPAIHFEIIGWGLKLPQVRSDIERRRLDNVAVMPPVPRSQLSDQLARCDVALILMVKGSSGTSVPCRLYNIMAAGRPVIVAADPDSEVATVVREGGIGWVVPPDAPAALAVAIREALQRPVERAQMGERARQLVKSEYSFDRAALLFSRVVASLDTRAQPEAALV